MSGLPGKSDVADKDGEDAGRSTSPEETGTTFRYDPWNPDAVQAVKTAREWRGGHVRSPLFCFVMDGCTIASEEQREALFQEIERDMKVVESSAEYFAVDELDKLRNLKRFVQKAVLAGQPNPQGENGKKEGSKKLGIELIY
jgi:hypothetical protein